MLETLSSIQKERSGAILQAVLTEGRITRRRLGELFDMSPSSVVKYTRALIDAGLLKESGTEESAVGRKRDYLEFDDRIGGNLIFAMDATKIEGALVKPSGKTELHVSVAVSKTSSKDERIAALYRAGDELFSAAKKKHKHIWGACIAMGGFLDPNSGISHEYFFSSDWFDVPLASLFESRYGVPCSIIKDTHALALGELYYGRGRGKQDFIALWLGESIGIGIVANGSLVSGAHFGSGELGHSRVHEGREFCYCGHSGCLEMEANLDYVVRRCREGLARGIKSRMLLSCQGDYAALTISMIIEAVQQGDRFAMNIFSEIAARVSSLLSVLVNTLSPEIVVLDGELAQGNEFFLQEMERALDGSCIHRMSGKDFLLLGEKNEDMRLKGASASILRGGIWERLHNADSVGTR